MKNSMVSSFVRLVSFAVAAALCAPALVVAQTLELTKEGVASTGNSTDTAYVGDTIDWTVFIDNRSMGSSIEPGAGEILRFIDTVDTTNQTYVEDSFEIPWPFVFKPDLNPLRADAPYLSNNFAEIDLEFSQEAITIGAIEDTGGGDGWGAEVAKVNGEWNVYWMNHHLYNATLKCSNLVTGDNCWGGNAIANVAASIGNFYSSDSSDVTIYDNKYAWWAYYSYNTGGYGFGCWDIELNQACSTARVHLVTASGDDKKHWVDSDLDISPDGRAFSGDERGRLHCFRADTGAPCSGGSTVYYTPPSTGTFESKVGPVGILDEPGNRYLYLIPDGTNTSDASIACVDITNAQPCSGWTPNSWPSIGASKDNKYAAYFLHWSSGVRAGVCFPSKVNDEPVCVRLSDGSIYSPANNPSGNGSYGKLDEPTTNAYDSRSNRLYIANKKDPSPACWDFTTSSVCSPNLDLEESSYYALTIVEELGCGLFNSHDGVIGSFDLVNHELPCDNTFIETEQSAKWTDNFCSTGTTGATGRVWDRLKFTGFDGSDFESFNLKIYTDASLNAGSLLREFTSVAALPKSKSAFDAIWPNGLDLIGTEELYFVIDAELVSTTNNPFDPANASRPSVTLRFKNQDWKPLEACLQTIVTAGECETTTEAKNTAKLRIVNGTIYDTVNASLRTLHPNDPPCGIDLELTKDFSNNVTLEGICSTGNVTNHPRDNADNCDPVTGNPLPDIAYCTDEIVYQVTIQNWGPDAASGIEVTDYLPSNFKYISDSLDPPVGSAVYSGPGSQIGGSLVLSWQNGEELNPNSSATWSIQGQVQC